MKNLKITLMAFMALFLTFGLTSCGDDDDDNTDAQSGTSGTAAVLYRMYISNELLRYHDAVITYTDAKGKTHKETVTYSSTPTGHQTVSSSNDYKLRIYDVELGAVTLDTKKSKSFKANLTFVRNSTEAPTTGKVTGLFAYYFGVYGVAATGTGTDVSDYIYKENVVFDSYESIVGQAGGDVTAELTYAKDHVYFNDMTFLANLKTYIKKLQGESDDDDESTSVWPED